VQALQRAQHDIHAVVIGQGAGVADDEPAAFDAPSGPVGLHGAEHLDVDAVRNDANLVADLTETRCDPRGDPLGDDQDPPCGATCEGEPAVDDPTRDDPGATVSVATIDRSGANRQRNAQDRRFLSFK